MEVTVYQTLTDKGNPDQIEAEGPFICNKRDAWLGRGYYFWEYSIDNAHWWGKEKLQTSYVICQATYVRDEKCLDLVDNPEHFSLLHEIVEIMKEKGLYKTEETTVARIIEYLRRIGKFPFEATRVPGTGSRKRESECSNIILFKSRHPAFLDLCPPYQICFYSKKALQLSGYKIVYPEAYMAGYGA
ncbi:MAG: hypothetical protein K2I32_03490 [Alistipes sp.]|nr:hypothetical protein [Alistipes sp.]